MVFYLLILTLIALRLGRFPHWKHTPSRHAGRMRQRVQNMISFGVVIQNCHPETEKPC